MRDRSLLVICAAGLLVFGAWTAFVVATDRPLDYYTYVVAADILSRGDNVFTMGEADYAPVAQRLGITNYAPPYRYPLLTALVVLPLRFLPLRWGAAIWVFVSGMAALGSARLLGAHAQHKWQKRLILLAVIGYVPIYTTLNAGQVNAFPLLFTAASIYAWRSRHDALGGAWLAVGLWFKPFAFALPALASWHARWTTFAGMLAAGALILLVSVLVFGVSLNVAQLEVFAGYQGIAAMAIPTNQSLTGLLSRWLTHNEFAPPLLDAPGLLAPARYIITAIVLVLVVWALWPPTLRRRAGPGNKRVALEAALLFAATHLLFTQTWYHHLAMLFIAFAALIEQWDDWRKPTRTIVALAAAYVLIDLHGLLWKSLLGMTLLLDGATWSEILVLMLLMVNLRQRAPTETA